MWIYEWKNEFVIDFPAILNTDEANEFLIVSWIGLKCVLCLFLTSHVMKVNIVIIIVYVCVCVCVFLHCCLK